MKGMSDMTLNTERTLLETQQITKSVLTKLHKKKKKSCKLLQKI